MQCLSVCVSLCLSVTFVYSVETNKHIFKCFSPSGSHTILGFPYQSAWQYTDGNLPNGDVEYRRGRQKSRLWAYIWLHCVLSRLQQARCYQQRRRTMVLQVVTLIAGSKRRSLLMAGYDYKMFMTRSLNVTPKTTEQHLIARSDKSVAYVINNKRLCSTFCTIEDNYWQTRTIARPLCDSRATCDISDDGDWTNVTAHAIQDASPQSVKVCMKTVER